MDISKLDRGLQIVGGGAVVLLISLFLPWYSVSASLGPGLAKVSDSASAWQVLSYTDLLLFLASVAAIAAVVAVGMGKLPELPAPLSQILLGISGVATLLVLFRLIFIPGNDGGGIVDIGRSVGVFIALIAAAAMVYGAMQTRAEPGPVAAPATRD